MTRILTILAATVAALAAVLMGLAVALVAVLLSMDWNWVKEPLTQRASGAMGRPLVIEGDLALDLLTWTPSLVARDVRFANPEWSSDPMMAELGRVSFAVDLWALLHGTLRVPGLTLADGVIRLEKAGDGAANWDFGASDGAGAAAVSAAAPEDRQDVPDIERLTFENLSLVWKDADAAPLEAVFTTLEANRTADGVTLAAKGSWKQVPYTLDGRLGPLESLQGEDPYPVALDIAAGGTTAVIDGTLGDPLAFTGVDAAITLKGPSLAELTTLLGLPLPSTPQYALSGRLTSDGSVWTLADFEGSLGSSDLRGTLAVETGQEVPRIDGTVRSRLLDFADLAGLLGEDAVAGQASGTAAPEDGGPVIPDDPLDLTGLRGVNAHVDFAATKIRRGGQVFQDFKGTADLDGGRLLLDPIAFGVADGTVAGTIQVDAGKDTPNAAAALRVRTLDMSVLVGDLDPQQATWGRLSGRMDLSGRGRSLHQIASTLDGKAVLYMGEGGIGNVLLEGIGLDVTEVIASLFSTDPNSPLKCLIVPMTASGGVVTVENMLLEAPDDTVLGDGTINLATETLTMKLRVHPRDFSLFNAPSVLTIDGSFAGDVGVDTQELVGQLLKKLAMIPLSPFVKDEFEGVEPCAPVRRALGREP